MSSKEVHFSDLSQEMISDPSQLAGMVVSGHSELEHPVKLDARADEVAQIGEKALKAVLVELTLPGEEQPSRHVLAEREFDKLAKGRTMKEILADAAPYVAAAVVTRRSHNRTTSGEPLRSFDTLEFAGEPHKGKVSQVEAQLVRDNLEAVNQRLTADGKPAIDPANPDHAKRYGFTTASAQAKSEAVSAANDAGEGNGMSQDGA